MVSNRAFRPALVIAMGLSCVLSSFATAESASPREAGGARPNIVLILTDDLGYGDVSFLNAESKIRTPHIDALAEQGVWFTDGHSPSAVCSPSRYALLTGRYAWRGPNTVARGVLMPWDEPVIEPDRPTLPRMLRAQGYHTALIGKWHLGFQWPWADGERPPLERIGRGQSKATAEMFDPAGRITGGPLAAGFDTYFGDDVPNFPPYAFIENERFVRDDLATVHPSEFEPVTNHGVMHGQGPGEPDWRLDRVMPRLIERAETYLRDRAGHDEPFFLMFSTTSPHTPIVPLPEHQGTSDAGPYGDFTQQLDSEVGRLVRTLEQTGQFENTLLIVSSDNGPAPFWRGLIRSHGHAAMGPWRGVKTDSWEGGHRVPLIVHWPAGGMVGGRRSDALVCLIDLYATIAELLDVDLPDDAAPDSQSVLAAFRDQGGGRESMVYHRRDGRLGLREGGWVFLRDDGSGPHGREPDWFRQQRGIEPLDATHGLYHLAEDPGQRRNLYRERPDKAREMDRRLQTMIDAGRTRAISTPHGSEPAHAKAPPVEPSRQ